jgi:hypothetical protein
MLESGTVNSDGGQAAAPVIFSHRAHRNLREKILAKFKALILFFVSIFSVLSFHGSVLFHAGPCFKAFNDGVHVRSARAFNENPITGF